SLIAPASRLSKPAMQRRVVVLPQPDGPSSEKNSPAFTSNEIGPTLTSAEYRRTSPLTSSSTVSGMSTNHRHPGKGRDPLLRLGVVERWIPAFAGMTTGHEF